jgi:hypothetical protein
MQKKSRPMRKKEGKFNEYDKKSTLILIGASMREREREVI